MGYACLLSAFLQIFFGVILGIKIPYSRRDFKTYEGSVTSNFLIGLMFLLLGLFIVNFGPRTWSDFKSTKTLPAEETNTVAYFLQSDSNPA